MARPRKYPEELLERGVRLVFESGRPIAHVAKDLGVSSEVLRKRVRLAEAENGSRPDLPSAAEREEIRKLRRENYELRRANEDTTDCPRRWFSGARSSGAGAASAGGPVPGIAGLLASPRRVAPVARVARWQPLADPCGVD
jgi:transposase